MSYTKYKINTFTVLHPIYLVVQQSKYSFIMASIKLVQHTQQEDATGQSPIYIRLIKDRKAKFVTTGVKAKVGEWDEAKQKLKKNYSNSARMNVFLA